MLNLLSLLNSQGCIEKVLCNKSFSFIDISRKAIKHLQQYLVRGKMSIKVSVTKPG